MKRFGTLFGVGVGPGDPGLMTFKAAEILRRSTVIAYVINDRGESFARQTAGAYFPATVHELPLNFSMAPQREKRLAARVEAAQQVLELLSHGQDVTFITEGDPLLYSTFQHLLAALPPEATVEICPGVSSLTASAAEACFPLAIEEDRMAVAAANAEVMRRLPGWLETFEIIILFKVHRHAKALQAMLKESNHIDRAVLVQHASLSGQAAVVDLDSWDQSPLPYFTTLLIRTRRQA
jgi:precorrin-2/cobalt-factor-2 C20-methyltransferase